MCLLVYLTSAVEFCLGSHVPRSCGSPFAPFVCAVVVSRRRAVKWERFVGKTQSDMVFYTLEGAASGVVGGMAVKGMMEESGLGMDVLAKIWDLSDVDQDGFLDDVEFALAVYLIKETQATGVAPDALSADLFPPSKRK